jgi:hypothetical protein
LRAFTPRDQKAVKAAADTFRANPKLDTGKVITELGKGEALVSFLEGSGTPRSVDRVLIRPPAAQIGPITPEGRKSVIAQSPVRGKYDQPLDAESAYEVLQGRTQGKVAGGTQQQPTEQNSGGVIGEIGSVLGGIFGTGAGHSKRLSTGQVIAREVTRSVTNRVAGQIAADFGKTIGGRTGATIGRAIIRGTLGGILRR